LPWQKAEWMISENVVLFLVCKNQKTISHLTLNQRYDIEVGLSKKLNNSQIEELIGKHSSVVDREI